VQPWETGRTIDVIWQYLELWARDSLKDEDLRGWVMRFREDKWAAARAYWDEVRAGIAEAFAAGAAAIPDVLAPNQVVRVDVMARK